MGSPQLLVTPSYLVSLSPTSNVSLISSSTSSSPIFSISSVTTPSSISSQQSRPPKQNLLEIPHPLQHNNVGLAATSSSSSTPSPIIRIDSPVEVPIPIVAAAARTEPETNTGNPLVQQNPHHHHARLEAIVSNMGKAKNGHVCLYCGKLYSRKYGLKIHIRTHTGYKPLRCKICHRPFGDPSNLNKHVRLHSDGSTPYRCELCSKVLVRRRDLDRHIRARHGTSAQNSMRGGNNIAAQQRINGSHSSAVTSSVVSSSRM
ncbi:PR domain zinc finger protein 13 [Orchesella cincta]|uniref:PR domain zinc finger protein 13 n=1 Tax=Orchesella cincta TaxID=48709 RepID=A0A1D2N454_ORCCI|nr:PR domain zinc finger protein 13 [Orchesella cincta]